MTVEALNGKKFFLVDIIAQILHFLKQEFIVAYLQRGGHQLSALDFDWVITVPAIWRARGKQMMREAGYMVSACGGRGHQYCLHGCMHIVLIMYLRESLKM